MSACGFWRSFSENFYDVRIFNPNARSHKSSAISSCYRLHEQEKKRHYKERVKRIEHASFTTLVFSCTGGASTLTSTFWKRLGSLLSLKQNIVYSTSIKWKDVALALPYYAHPSCVSEAAEQEHLSTKRYSCLWPRVDYLALVKF